jgi:hypothetical protein
MFVIGVLALVVGIWKYRSSHYLKWAVAATISLMLGQFALLITGEPSDIDTLLLNALLGRRDGQGVNTFPMLALTTTALVFAYCIYRAVEAALRTGGENQATNGSVDGSRHAGGAGLSRKIVETVGLLLLILVWAFAQNSQMASDNRLRSAPLAAKPSIEQKIAIAADRINAASPRTVNARTVLERATASGRTLTYHYRLDATAEQRDEILTIGREHVVSSACDSPLRSDLRRGATIAFSYSGVDFDDPILVTVDEQACSVRRGHVLP